MSVFIYNVSFDDSEVLALIDALEFYIDTKPMDEKKDFENSKSMMVLLEKIKRYENIRMFEPTYPGQMLAESSPKANLPVAERNLPSVVPDALFSGYSIEEIKKANDVIKFILHSPYPPGKVGMAKVSMTNDEFIKAMIVLLSEFFVTKKWLAQDALTRVNYRSTLSEKFYGFCEKKPTKQK